ERTRIGSAPHAGTHVPGTVLLAGGRIVAIDAGDEPAVRREVVALGGVGAEFVDRRAANVGSGLGMASGRRDPEPLTDFLRDPGKVVPGGESTGTRPQIDDVAAFVGG